MREGENDRKGLQGVKRQEERRHGRKVTGRKRSRWEDYRRSEGKVTEKGRVARGGDGSRRGTLRLQLRHGSPPVISVSPPATRCVCVYVCVCVCAVREHQTGSKGLPGRLPYRSTSGFQAV